METMSLPSSPSSFSVSQGTPTYDEIFMGQSLFFSDSLKDLKTLRAQLYSAAEYFEESYTNDDHKQMVADTLKDYAVRAIINTVDHLGCASDKVNGLLDEKVDEVTGTELRVSCIEQKIRTCQENNDREGLSQQSLKIMTPKYDKRYILPAEESLSGSTRTAVKQQSFSLAVRKTTLDSSSSFRKICAPSPSPKPGTIFVTDKRAVSPVPTPRLFRSRSMSSRPTTANSSKIQRPVTPNSSQIQRTTTLNSYNSRRLAVARLARDMVCERACMNFESPCSKKKYPSEPQKSASMRLFNEKEGQKGTDQYPSVSKRLLKALLSRNKSKNDAMMYSYLDEY